MKIDVNALEVARRLIHSRIQIPVSGRDVTISYPLWNPGDHAPIQNVGRIGGLVFHAGNKTLVWKRDPIDMNAFHVTVPKDARTIQADFDFFLPAPGESFADSSQHLFILRWNLYTLYVTGQAVRDIRVQASAKLPPGWMFGTALPVDQIDGDTIRFKDAPLETVVDSPVLTGEFMKKIQLTHGESRAHEMDVAADSERDLPSEVIVVEKYGRLMDQAQLLFGTEHFRDYHFLVAVSDYTTPGGGFEHSESSDNRVPSNYFSTIPFDVIPHELAHSWNGKYRRPAGLYTDDYQQPERTDLLWVYESLTNYLGVLLTSRSGLWTDAYALERWAAVAAKVDHETGRTWLNMQGTVDAVPLTMNELFFSDPGWNSWLRMLDYYDEGALLWLEADAIIAEQTHGQHSLKDFLQVFYGGQQSVTAAPQVKTYTGQDVFQALNQIAPYNWKRFFETRLNSLSPHAPLGGLEKSGWRLIYNTQPNVVAARRDGLGTSMYSLGLAPTDDGMISDVERGGASDVAGIFPGMKIVSVNGQPWARATLLAAIVSSKQTPDPIRLGTTFAGVSKEFDIGYHGGILYPHLERIQGVDDTLTHLMKPLLVSSNILRLGRPCAGLRAGKQFIRPDALEALPEVRRRLGRQQWQRGGRNLVDGVFVSRRTI